MSQPHIPLSILIADDDARVRHGLRALIESQPDFTVVGEASSALEVEESDAKLSPTIVLLDLVLAGETVDLDLLRLLVRTRGRTVIAISVHSGLHDAALAAGARAFVDKGCSPDRLLEALRLAGESTGPIAEA